MYAVASSALIFAPFSIFAHSDVVVFVFFVSCFVLVSYDFIHKLYIINIREFIICHLEENLQIVMHP
jgi:hypothetical protein